MNARQDLNSFNKAVEDARKHGIANEISIRNMNIYGEYLELRAEFKSYMDSIYKLADKYCLGYKAIEKIILRVRQSVRNKKAG
jgi:hypothetical protein